MKLEQIAIIQIGLLKSRLCLHGKFSDAKVFKIIDRNQDADYLHANLKCITIHAECNFDKSLIIKKDDIIINLFPPFNVYKIDFNAKDYIVLSNFAIIRPESINAELLYFAIKNELKHMQNMLEGSTIRVFNLRILKQLDLNLSDMDVLLKQTNVDRKFNKIIDLLLQKTILLEKQKKYLINHCKESKNGK